MPKFPLSIQVFDQGYIFFPFSALELFWIIKVFVHIWKEKKNSEWHNNNINDNNKHDSVLEADTFSCADILSIKLVLGHLIIIWSFLFYLWIVFNSLAICMAIMVLRLVDQLLELLAWERLDMLWQEEPMALEWKLSITTGKDVKQMRNNLVRNIYYIIFFSVRVILFLFSLHLNRNSLRKCSAPSFLL